MTPRRPSRRGNAVLTATLLATVLGFTALSVDLGLVRVARTQLQTAVDAAAVSGAQELDGTAAGITAARARAIEFGAYNAVLTKSVKLTTSDVVVGAWNSDTSVFVPYVAGESTLNVNAVRIQKSGADVVPMLGSMVFGTDALQVRATSMGLRELNGGPLGNSACFLPFAIPDCHLSGLAPGQNPKPMSFQMSPTPKDKIAWGDPDNNPTTSDSKAQMLGSCDMGQVGTGDPMYVNEGNHTSAIKTVADIINKKTSQTTQTWDPSKYGPMPARDGIQANVKKDSAVTTANWGNTFQGVVALVDGGTSCNTVSFTGTKPITGFAWAILYDVSDTTTTKNIWMQIDVTAPHEVWGEPDENAKGTNVTGVGDASLGGS